MNLHDRKGKILKKVIFLNIALVIAEIFAGIYSGSMALLADAFHNLGDVLALFISLVAIIYGAKKANDFMTFGYIKAEMMAAFVNAIFLIITMLFILVESIERFFTPNPIDAPVVIVASLAALLINGFSTWLLSKSNIEHHHHHHDGHEHHNHEDMNIRSAYLHMLGDAVISFSVAVGGVLIYFFGIVAIDSILSIIFSIYILRETLPLLKKSFYSLMDSNTDDAKEVEAIMLSFDEVLSIHDLHLYRPSSSEYYGSAHIVFKDDLTLSSVEKILDAIRDRLCDKGITHFIIQPESREFNQNSIYCAHH
ncbi:MAG: cation diffusion facilitator family transporter [Sulfurimonas sp.]|uniref:cation diffusion facilitator family transporter n=1 Tax=Sulfurimonas sp. TaxID=2022749 RepID=UPI00260909C6|nr:cation diffusion facilitator family transporter [Sulfurimonas sp.]MDD3476542.1 cation diffusion facilitator family transporter [Sulfurimonas sp.]